MKRFEGFQRGVNLGGWFSQCDYSAERLNGFILEDDFATIAKWGLDHVRIPFDYNIVQHEDGSFIAEGFAHLERAVGWCRKHGLNAILDLHKTIGFNFGNYADNHDFFDSEEKQGCFFALWEELARIYGRYSDCVAFDLLNEVTDKAFAEKWSRIALECIRRIRVHAPNTYILLGGYNYNSVEAVPDLPAPPDDKVVYNFHCYLPMLFTHQGARWCDPEIAASRCDFADLGIDESFFLQYFEVAREAAERNGTTLYCGEYGVIDVAKPEEAVKWYRTINTAFEQVGIGRAAWSYREMDFGISDSRMDGVRDELLRYM